MERLTEWADGAPPMPGWWDTKAYSYIFERAFEVRLWWDGYGWKASPHSTNFGFRQNRKWRGLADKPVSQGAASAKSGEKATPETKKENE